MKNKKHVIEKYLKEYHYIKQIDSIIWYYDPATFRPRYSEDKNILYSSGQNKFYDHLTKKFFTPRQFARYITRLNHLKAFW